MKHRNHWQNPQFNRVGQAQLNQTMLVNRQSELETVEPQREGELMQVVWWLDRLRKWGRRRRGGTQFRCPRWSLVVECLETRTQLTGVMFLATEDPAVFELSVPQRGAVTLAIRNGDDSRFVGEVALLSPSGRVLREQPFVAEPEGVASVLTETVAPGSYLVRFRPAVLKTTAPQVDLQFQATSDFSVGDVPLSVQVANVKGNGRLDLVTSNRNAKGNRCD